MSSGATRAGQHLGGAPPVSSQAAGRFLVPRGRKGAGQCGCTSQGPRRRAIPIYSEPNSFQRMKTMPMPTTHNGDHNEHYGDVGGALMVIHVVWAQHGPDHTTGGDSPADLDTRHRPSTARPCSAGLRASCAAAEQLGQTVAGARLTTLAGEGPTVATC